MTIEAKELRIGNIAEWSTPNMAINIKQKEHVVRAKDIVNFENKIILLEPIPLTEEWLVRLGFPCIWCGQGDGSTYEKGTVHIHRHHEKNSPFRFYWQYSRDGNTKWEHIGSPSAELKYVHQLQNLYRALTGEELKITT